MMTHKKLEKLIFIGIIFNILLTVIKLTFGYIGHSQALITDGYNSLSDVLMSIMVFIIIKVSTREPDEDHPYGHQKYEGLVYFALGIIFGITAITLLVTTIKEMIIFINDPSGVLELGIISLYVSVIALLIKFFLASFYYRLYKNSNHPTLKAESNNHSIDMIATTFTVIGILLAKLGFVIFDYIAALIIAALILRLAIKTLKESVEFLVDQAPEQTLIDEVFEFISASQGVISVDDLKIRKHMTELYIDVEIGVDGTLSLKDAHQIAEYVHHRVEKQFLNVIHCMVHVNPVKVIK